MWLAFWPDFGTMGAVSQLLCLFLAALFALAGGPLSLCACGPGTHAAAAAAAPPPAGCCGPSEPVPLEPACCCCAGPAQGAAGPSLAAACECPELDLSLPVAEVASSAERTATPQHVAPLAPSACLAPLASPAGAELLFRAAPPPDPGAHPPRHLLLHVLRH